MSQNTTHYRNYVDGRWLESPRRFADVNPVDGSSVATVHEADAATVDAAVRAGHTALAGRWGRTTPPERAALLYRIHVEEAALTGAFGQEYVEYSRTTKRLIPGIY